MLKANVGLSRKVSRDYQSSGYTVNIDGEIPFTPDDAEGVLEKVRELFDLAQEALNREVDRDQGESAVGRQDEETAKPVVNGKPLSSNGQNQAPKLLPASKVDHENLPEPVGNRGGNDEVATNKQVQFILTMGKRSKLSVPQLENRIHQILGRACGVYDLTKKEAGRVLDQLTTAG